MTCVSSADCLPNDMCARGEDEGTDFCITCRATEVITVDEGNCEGGSDSEGGVPRETPDSTGLPLDGGDHDDDHDDNDGHGDHNQDQDDDEEFTPPSGGDQPEDNDNASSSSSTDNGTADIGTNDDDDGSSCIAVSSLASTLTSNAARALVYVQHRRAAVLCDGAGNCATPHHIVVHAGTAQTMASYCALLSSFSSSTRREQAGCTRRVALVNSPRMTRGLRVPSRSPDLAFTAFAAPYGTRAEEWLLAAVVYVGL